MDFILKNILKTIFTVFLTLLILVGLIWGFVYVWQKINDEKTTDENGEQTEVTENPENPISTIPDDGKGPNLPEPQPVPDELVALPYPGPRLVETETTVSDKPTILSKTAVITPEQEVAIFPQASGILAKLNVNVGDQIEAGQTIGQISNSLQLEQAAASLDSAVKSLDVAKQTLSLTKSSNQVTASTFDEQLQNANIGIQTAMDQLSQARIGKHQQADTENLKTEIAKLSEELTQLQTTNTDAENTTEILALQDEIARSQQTLQQIGYNTQNTQFQYQDSQLTNSIATSQNQLTQLRSQLQNQAISGEIQELSAISQINQISQQIASHNATLKTGTIQSTIGGIVSEINVKPGETTSPSQAILTITNPDSNIIEAQLTIRDVQTLSQNTTVDIKTELGDFPGEILFISPIPNPSTKLVTVKIGVTNPEDATAENKLRLPTILTNSFAKITFTTPPVIAESIEGDDNGPVGFTVPINQVEFINKTAHIAVVENNLITYKPVVIGKIINGRTEIVSGLEAGTPIVVSPRKPLAGAAINLPQNNG